MWTPYCLHSSHSSCQIHLIYSEERRHHGNTAMTSWGFSHMSGFVTLTTCFAVKFQHRGAPCISMWNNYIRERKEQLLYVWQTLFHIRCFLPAALCVKKIMHVLMDALFRLRVCMHMQCAENIVIASVHSVTQKLFCSLCLSVIWPKANRICVIVQMKHLLDINKTDFLNIIYFKKHRNPLITSKSIALFCMQTMLISYIIEERWRNRN